MFLLARERNHQTIQYMQKGDTVRPRGESARSSRGVIVTRNDKLTVATAATTCFVSEEVEGIFQNEDFTIVTPPSVRQRGIKGTSPEANDRSEPATRSRKALRRSWEKVLHATLEWRDSYLCFADTGTRIPDSPHVPNTAKQTWQSHRRHH